MPSVAITYARAFADAVFENKADALALSRRLQQVLAMLAANPGLREVWQNPSVPAQQKHAVLAAIARRSGMPPLVRNFLAVIIDRRRVLELGEIAARFQAEALERLGLAEAEIASARELSPEERKRMEAGIAAATGKSIRAHYKTDPALLGGAMARVGSTVYDGTVKGQLQRLKQQLLAG